MQKGGAGLETVFRLKRRTIRNMWIDEGCSISKEGNEIGLIKLDFDEFHFRYAVSIPVSFEICV